MEHETIAEIEPLVPRVVSAYFSQHNFDVVRNPKVLEHNSAYAGTHYALALVAEHRSDRRTADVEFGLAEKAWNKVDHDLPELSEIRKKLAFR